MTLSVVFQGYAPVHALCFAPIYSWLRDQPGVEVTFTGGYKRGHRPERVYRDPVAMFGSVGIPAGDVIEVGDAALRNFDVLVSAATHPIVPFDRCTERIQIFHGISMRNRGVRRENLAYDHLWMVGPYMRRLFQSLDLLREDDPRAVPIGFPKTDPLVRCENDCGRDRIRARLGVPDGMPMALYAPTGAEHNSFELQGLSIASEVASAGLAHLVVKHHDHPRRENELPEAGSLEQMRGVTVCDDLDVVPLLQAADVLITDASSVANEFLLLDRPLIFVDVPDMFDLTATKGAFVDVRSRDVGVVATTPEDVVLALRDSLTNPDRHGDARRDRVADLYFNPGTATSAAIAWFANRYL